MTGPSETFLISKKSASSSTPHEDYESSIMELRSALVSYFRRHLPAPEDSEDLAHEVIIRLLRRPAEHKINALRPYLFQVAKNVLVDSVRRNNVRCKTSHEPLSDDIPDAAHAGFEGALIARQEMECVRTGLMELSARTRSIFLLRRLEGMKHQEIAANLGVSLSTVEKHVRLAAMHLKGRLERAA